MSRLPDLKDTIRYLALFAFALVVVLIGVTRPLHNWDMIGYVAAVNVTKGAAGPGLLRETFAIVEKEVSDKTFVELTTNTRFRVTVYGDYRSLEQQVPFYSIRPLYVVLSRILGDWFLDSNYARATYVISALSSGLAVPALYFTFFRDSQVPLAFLPIIAAFAGLLGISRTSTPDALNCLFFVLCIWAGVTGRKASFLLSSFLPAVRTDATILSVLMSIYAYRAHALLALASLVIALTVYFATLAASGNYGGPAPVSWTPRLRG